MLKSISGRINKTYVGFSKDIKSRLNKHNSNKGAKATRGYKWILIYKKRFKSKSEAMSYEYKLKKNKKKRSLIVQNFL
tara:strand:- start:1849 stop:2082 length:234 start_codon:yes stop_codon:yes gene_type:complete